jgi:predicted small secreted protein
MKYLFSVLACATALSGCATVSDCGGDWYAIGQRDGRLGATPQAELYARRCSTVNAARYGEGWREGFSQRPRPVVLLLSIPAG